MTDTEMEDIADEIAHDVVDPPEDDADMDAAMEKVAHATDAAFHALASGGTRDAAIAAAQMAAAGRCPVCSRRFDDHGLIPCTNRYTLDGAPVDASDFADQQGLAAPDFDAIGNLPVGEALAYPAGVLRRLS